MNERPERQTLGALPTYGSYTNAQLAYAFKHLDLKDSTQLLDPMCGSANLLAHGARLGLEVTGWDVNPAVLVVAAARSPIAGVSNTIFSKLRHLVMNAPSANEAYSFNSSWLPNKTRAALEELGSAHRETLMSEELRPRRTPEAILLAAAVVLSARQIASFRRTKNVTWLKAGGVPKSANWRDPVLAALDILETLWVNATTSTADPVFARRSILNMLDERDLEHYGSIAVSPPYANRLNYEVMWGPEIAVLGALTGQQVVVGTTAMGSNQIKGRPLASNWEQALTPALVEALTKIAKGTAKASRTYYFPYFLQYCLELKSLLERVRQLLQIGGKVTVFVRDVVRKDVLLPLGDFVVEEMEANGLNLLASDRDIVRNHIGLRRPQARGSQYGDAQVEWSLCFAK